MKDIAVVLGVSVVAMAGAAYMIVDRDSDRPKPALIVKAKERLDQANARLEVARASEHLPPLQENWLAVEALLAGCGLQVEYAGDPGDGSFYAGPTNHWSGAVGGIDEDVLACSWLAVQMFPVVLNTLTLGGGSAQLTFSVLGSV